MEGSDFRGDFKKEVSDGREVINKSFVPKGHMSIERSINDWQIWRIDGVSMAIVSSSLFRLVMVEALERCLVAA